jgi:hypothetical protein
MTAKQHIFRVRRNYNQWVANQTLEDYALRFTAKSARRWSAARVATTALGAISFLALEAIGGAITLHYGFNNAVAAIMAVSLIIFLTAIPISYYAAKYGVDIDLLTRGAGFDLRILHVYFFRARSCHYGDGFGFIIWNPARMGILNQFIGDNPTGNPRHYLYQPVPIMEPTTVDYSAVIAVCFYYLCRCQRGRKLDRIFGRDASTRSTR